MRALLLLLASLLLCPAGAAPAAATNYNGCTAEQQQTLTIALVNARAAAASALDLIGQKKADRYLTAWFGNPGSAPEVARVLTAIHLILDPATPLVMTCATSTCEHKMVGYLREKEVSVCPDFFNAPPSDAYDSQAGTFIHELSHAVANTGDHAYGPADARRLAAENPAQAIRNADNYQYFVEALTGLVPSGDQPFNAANSCRWAYDGECDETRRRGTGACPPGTDTRDCQSSRSAWQSRPASGARKTPWTR